MNPGKTPAITTSRKTFRHAAEYAAVRLFYFILRLWPLSFLRELAGLFGAIARIFTPRRVRIATENLTASFPQMSQAEVGRIVRAVYRNLAACAIETVDLPSVITTVKADSDMLTKFKRLVEEHEAGKPLLVVTGHYGNWEVLAQYLAVHLKKTSFLAKEQSNPFIDRMVNRQREALGGKIIPSHAAARAVPKLLKSGGCLLMAVDQDAGSDGVMIEFLGRTAAHFRGWAMFSYHFRVPVVFALMRREGECFVLELTDPIEPNCDADKNDEIKRLLILFADYLAAAVKAHPEQWLWTHRRWKSGTTERSPT